MTKTEEVIFELLIKISAENSVMRMITLTNIAKADPKKLEKMLRHFEAEHKRVVQDLRDLLRKKYGEF
jgi:hypothetical protein